MCAIVYVVKSAVCIIWWGYYIWQNRIRDREQVAAGISDEEREKANTIAVETDQTDKGESTRCGADQKIGISVIMRSCWQVKDASCQQHEGGLDISGEHLTGERRREEAECTFMCVIQRQPRPRVRRGARCTLVEALTAS